MTRYARRSTNGADAIGTPLREAVYAYDLVGNRTQTVIDGATETYALGVGNRLATFGANAYTHDAAGGVTSIARAGQPALDLTWDAQYRLTAVSTNGVVVEAYGYDPLGRRAYTATATSSGTVTNWHAYVGLHCVADLDAGGTVLRSYTYGPGIDNLLAMTVHGATETNTYFALTDHLGTVHALVSSVGSVLSVVESYCYDAWGNVLAVHDAQGSLLPASSLGNRFLFQCRDYSWATRLTNFRARWYDPSTGRWLSNDPIGISGGLNQYVFCGNDPVDYVDPEGDESYYTGSDGKHSTVIVPDSRSRTGYSEYSFIPTEGGYGDGLPPLEKAREKSKALHNRGEMRRWDTVPAPDWVRIETTADEECLIRKEGDRLFGNPGDYDFFFRNCAHVARSLYVESGFLNVPNITGKTYSPNGVMEDLQERSELRLKVRRLKKAIQNRRKR